MSAITLIIKGDASGAVKALQSTATTAEKEIGRAGASTERWKVQLQQLPRVAAASFTVAAAALAALTRTAINAADQIDEMSQRIGVSAEEISTLQYAAQRGGVELGAFEAGLIKLAKAASDTAMGTGAAQQGFAALGIGVKDAEGNLKSADVLFKEVAGALAQYEDGTAKTALAVNLFGKSGAQLLPIMKDGAKGIQEVQDRARDLGLEIDNTTAAMAGEFNDSLDDLRALARGFGNDLAKELLPFLNSLTEEMVENGIETRKTSGAAEGLATTFEALATTAIVIKNGIEQLTIATAAFIDSAAAVGKFAVDTNVLTIAWRALNGEVKPVGDSLDELTGRLGAVAQSAQTGLIDSFNDGARAVMAFLKPIKETNKAIEQTGRTAKGAAPGLRDLQKEQRESEKALKELDKEWMEYVQILEDVKRDHKEVAESYAAQQAHFDRQAQDIENEIRLLGLSGQAREDYAIRLRAESMALDQNGNLMEERADEFEDQLKRLSKAAKLDSILGEIDTDPLDELIKKLGLVREALQNAMANGPPELVKELQASFAQLNHQIGVDTHAALESNVSAMQAGFRSLQSMTQEGSKAYKAMEVASHALNVVLAISAILNQGKGDPWTAFARMAAMAAAVAGLVGSIGSFSGGPSSSSAEARQERQGTGTVLGDAEAKSESMLNALEITADATEELVGLNRGMLNALQAMQRGISGAAGNIARTEFADLELDDAAFANAFGPLATIGGALLGSIFGGDQDLIDRGLLIRGGAFGNVSSNPRASTYQTVETDGGWFGSDRTSDNLDALSAAATTQIRLILESLGNAVREGARALGLNMEEVNAAIAAFRIEEIRISTMDLTGEEAQAELEAAFSAIFDELAGSVVPFIDQFQRVGEGLGETLVRVATSVQVAQESFTQLGLSVGEMDPETMAQVSVALVEAAGGIEDFISGMQSFVANFAPEAHQFEIAQNALTSALEQVGLVLPETREGMWELMQSLDATTESGRAQIATLLRLAGVANNYYDMLEDGADSATAAARAAMEAAAEAAAQDADARALLMGITRDRDYSQMSSAARAIADVNARFSDLRIALNETNPTLAEAAELENARTQAIEDATAALLAQGQALVDNLVFEESLVGMSEVEQAVARINQQFDEYVEEMLDLGFALDSTQIATINAIRATRIARVEMEELAEVVTVSFADMRGSVSVFIEDMRKQFEHLMDPGFRDWIEGLTGIVRNVESPTVTRAGVLDEVAQSYAAGVASLSTQLAAAQAELDLLGDSSSGPQRSVLLGKIRNLQQMLGDVTGALGDALDYANELFEQQIGDMLRDLGREFGLSDPITDINNRFDDLIDQATAWGASMAQLAEIEGYRIQALQQAQEEAFQQEMDWLNQLRALRDSLLLDESVTTLTPAERFAEAQRQYRDVYGRAMAGEEGARGMLDQVTRNYLQIAREMYASSQPYDEIFNAVRNGIDALIAASPANQPETVVAQQMVAASAATATATNATVERLAARQQQADEHTTALLAKLEAVCAHIAPVIEATERTARATEAALSGGRARTTV